MVFDFLRRQGRRNTAAPPEGSVVYAVGDVHGCLSLLLRLEQRIEEDMQVRQAQRRIVVFLGDYIDRGADSRGVIEHLANQRLPDCEAIYLAGNHDRWLIRFLDGASVGPVWLQNGGAETLASYGVPVPRSYEPEAMAVAQRQLLAALPQSHRAFLTGLPLSHTEGDYFFAHAGVRPGIPLAEQEERDLTWIREEFLYSDENFGKVVVHGHTPTPAPEEFANRIGVDTGAYMSGRLSAVVLEGTKRQFLHS